MIQLSRTAQFSNKGYETVTALDETDLDTTKKEENSQFWDYFFLYRVLFSFDTYL